MRPQASYSGSCISLAYQSGKKVQSSFFALLRLVLRAYHGRLGDNVWAAKVKDKIDTETAVRLVNHFICHDYLLFVIISRGKHFLKALESC